MKTCQKELSSTSNNQWTALAVNYFTRESHIVDEDKPGKLDDENPNMKAFCKLYLQSVLADFVFL